MTVHSTPGAGASSESASAPLHRDRLTRRERGVWRAALVLLTTLALAFAITSWDSISAMPHHLEALPVGLVLLVALFVAYAWSKTTEIAELRGLVRGIEQRANPVKPTTDQFDQLFSLISKSQQGYRDLIDTFEDFLFSLSIDGKILTVNRSFADLLELSFAEVVGRPVEEFIEFPDSASGLDLQRAIPRFIEKRSWNGVVRVRVKKTAAVYYFDCVLHPILRDDTMQGVSGFARDITRERENETRFTELFQTLREGVYLASDNDRITDANPALVQMLGFKSKEDILNHEISSLYSSGKDREQERERLSELGFLAAREVTLAHRQQGKQVIAVHTAAAIHDQAGNFVRYQGTFVDVTEQREMERRLHKEQEFARRLMDSFPDLVVVLDREARYTFVSPQVFHVLGYQPEELIGKRVGSRTEFQDRAASQKLFDDLVSNRLPDGQFEYRTQHKSGAWRVFRASARPLHDEAGQVTGVIASVRDITEQQRLENQVIQSERLAAMGQMIAGVAHELNNPLTAILGVTELLRDNASEESSRRQLDLAHKQARRAAHIVQSLLVFSRPATPHKTLLLPADLLQRTIQLHEHSLRANHINVDFVARPDLPTVLGDANQLTQVFLNLIVNAEQAIREVREQGTLRIRLGLADERLLITFQDDGVGIPREMLNRIFDPFFTTKRPGRGTGLGLSICMAIVREHNGDISAQPGTNGGSVFTVALPVCVVPPTIANSIPAIGQSHEIPKPDSSPTLARKKILAVDDEESILELVAGSLGARGCLVDRADCFDDALEFAGRDSYDAILCDLNLETKAGQPISGFDLYDRISKTIAARSGKRPIFVFMTGELVDDAAREKARYEGNRILQKPFRMAELQQVLTEAFSPAAVLQPGNGAK